MNVHVYENAIDTWEKSVFYQARHEIDFSSESAFYEAYAYWFERPVADWYIQRKFIEYMHSGGELPDCCVQWALDVLAKRIWY